MKDYDDIIGNERVRAFLALIRKTEGAGYSTLFGGGTFAGFADHPRQRISRPLGGRVLTSTAAGAYQFLSRTWDECAAACGLKDFSPASQDTAALFLIDRREALGDVLAGDWPAAIARCNKEWASLPGSPYGQPTRPLAECLAFLDRAAPTGPTRATTPAGGGAGIATLASPSVLSRVLVMPAFLRALKSGEELANAATWKNRQSLVNAVSALVLAGAEIARGYGYPVPFADDQLTAVAGVIVVLLFNAWAALATSKRVGLPSGADPVATAGPAAAAPGGVAGDAAALGGNPGSGTPLPVLTWPSDGR